MITFSDRHADEIRKTLNETNNTYILKRESCVVTCLYRKFQVKYTNRNKISKSIKGFGALHFWWDSGKYPIRR